MTESRHAWLLAAVVVFALALHLPVLGMGFYADDYGQAFALEQPELDLPMKPWSLYDFGERADWTQIEAANLIFPWWTGDDWKIRFFRPLTSLALWLDHSLFGRWSVGHHLAGLATYLALLLLVHSLYLRLGLGRPAALAALAIFALSDSSVLPVGWPANRNSVLTAIFTVLAVRGTCARGGTPATAVNPSAVVISLVWATLACMSKESGVMAFALVGLRWLGLRVSSSDPTTSRRATIAAGLAVGLAGAFVLGLMASGYGTRSLFYATPWSDPGRFVGRLGLLLTAGLLSLAGPVPVDLAAVFPKVALPLSVGATVVLVPLVLWIARTIRGLPGVSFLAVWTVLTVVPHAGAPASERLLFVASIGGSALLAVFFLQRKARADSRWLPRLATLVLLFASTVGSGSILLVTQKSITDLARWARETVHGAEVGGPDQGPRDAFVLQAESGLIAFALPSTFGGEIRDPALAVHLLQAGRRGLRWTRVDERTFELETTDEPFLTNPFERVYLVEEGPPPVGARWTTPRFEVEAVFVDDTGLRRLRVRLDGSLDDSRFRFLVDGGGRLVSLEPPEIGETVVIPTAVPRNPFMP